MIGGSPLINTYTCAFHSQVVVGASVGSQLTVGAKSRQTCSSNQFNVLGPTRKQDTTVSESCDIVGVASGCVFHSIPVEVTKLASLERLDLSNNDIYSTCTCIHAYIVSHKRISTH